MNNRLQTTVSHLDAGIITAYRTWRGQTFPDAADAGTRHRLRGPVLDRYRAEGGPDGALGLPVSDQGRAVADPVTPMGADRAVRFAHGAIYLDSAVGATKVVLWVVDDGPTEAD